MPAIYLITDEGLSDIAGLNAKRIAEIWDCDTHVFVERRDPTQSIREFRHPRLFYHYERLGHFLPPGLPEDKKWPKIVYLRLFVPQLLRRYSRLLYLDADILALNADHRIWDINLPSGFGAVSDLATLNSAPHDIKGMDRQDWLTSVGVNSGRYLNSGMMLIETEKWLETDFAPLLPTYFSRYPDAARYDQDFLAHVFDGRWTELSPRLNYQAHAIDLGLTAAVDPIFVHFCRTHKPWHGPSNWATPVNERFSGMYREMILAEGLDPTSYERKPRLNLVRRLKYSALSKISRLGFRSSREKKAIAQWQRKGGKLRSYIDENLAHGGFPDDPRPRLDLPTARGYFDGRFISTEEVIPAMRPSWDRTIPVLDIKTC